MLRDVPVSVNVSGRHVVHPRVVQDVERTPREFGVDPRRLVIEVAQTSFVEDFQTAARFLCLTLFLCTIILLQDLVSAG